MTAVLPHLILYFPTAAAALPHDGDAKPPDRIHHDFPDHLPAGVRSLIGSRCERFQPPALPYDRQHFAFTHVPKMGGTSMQVFLQRVARRAGKVVFNVRTQAKALNLTMDQMRKRASGADVLIGHAPIWWEEQAKSLNWRGGNFSRVTMMRRHDSVRLPIQQRGPSFKDSCHLCSESHTAARVPEVFGGKVLPACRWDMSQQSF